MKNEGIFDRFKANVTGVKTAASNLGKAVSSTAQGKPANLTNLAGSKLNSLFATRKSKLDGLLKISAKNSSNIPVTTFKSQDLTKLNKTLSKDIKTYNDHLQAVNEIFAFLQDVAKLFKLKDTKAALGYINSDPNFKAISDYLGRSYSYIYQNVYPSTPMQPKPKKLNPVSAPTKTTKTKAFASAAPTPTGQSAYSTSTTIPENNIVNQLNYKDFYCNK